MLPIHTPHWAVHDSRELRDWRRDFRSMAMSRGTLRAHPVEQAHLLGTECELGGWQSVVPAELKAALQARHTPLTAAESDVICARIRASVD